MNPESGSNTRQRSAPLASKRRRRIPRWLRWIALAILLVVLAHAGWTLYWMQRFDRRIEELRAAGIPMELTDFATPPIPDAENANVPWMQADAWYEEHLSDRESLMDRPEYDESGEEDFSKLREWLATGDRYVELLAEAVERKSMHEDLRWDLGPNMEIHSIPALARSAKFLDVRVKHADRASPDTLRELNLMFRLARKPNPGPVFPLLVRWTVLGRAADALRKYAALSEFDAIAAWETLADHLRSGPDTELLRRSFRVERAMVPWFARSLLAGQDVLSESTSSDTAITWHYRALIDRDAIRVLDQFDRAEARLELSPRAAWTAAAELPETDRIPFTWLTTGYANFFRGVLRSRVLYLAKMRVARVGLALHVVRQRTGSWPHTLDAVVSMAGEHDVLDPFTEERLAYVPGVSLEAVGAVEDEDLRENDEVIWRFLPDDSRK